MALNKNKVIAAAQRYTQKGQLDRAIREYKSIVEEDPEDVRIWLKIGDLYTRKGSISHAVQTYNRVAEHYRGKGFFLKAVAVYKSVLKIDPGYIDAHLALAEMYVKLGLVPDAISQFQIVVGSYERTGRRRESLELLKRVVDIAPDEVSNRIRLAEGYAAQEQQEAAVGQFRTVLDQLETRQRLEDFVQVAERLLYLAPEEHEVTRRLAQVYVKKGEPKRALARLQLLFRADPRDADTLTLLASTFNSLGQTTKAVAVYRELARVFAEDSNTAASVAAYRKLLELEPGDAEALEATGRMSGAFGSGPAASAEMSTDLMTDDQKLARYIDDVELLVKYELTDHAIERLRLAFEINPHHREALQKQRDLFKQLGRTDDAVETLLHLARVDELTDLEAASAHLQEALSLSPGHPAAAEHLDRLSRQSRPPMRPSAAPEPPPAVLAPPVDEGYAPPPPTGGFELDLDGIDFDDGLDELDMGEQPIELEAPEDERPQQDSVAVGFDELGDEPVPDDDPFGDLLAAEAADASEAAADAFGDLLHEPRDHEFGGLLVPDEPPEPSTEHAVGHLIKAAREDEFGDLLAGGSEPDPDPHGAATRPTDQIAAELADAPLPSADDFADAFEDLPPAGSLPDDDAFGDLLDDRGADAAGDDFGDLLLDAPGDGAAPAPPEPFDDDLEFGGSIDELRGLDDSILSRPPGVIAPPPPEPAGVITPPPPEPLGDAGGQAEVEFDDFGDIDFGDLPPANESLSEPATVILEDTEGLADGFFDDLLQEAEEAERSIDDGADDAAMVDLSGFDLGDFDDAGPSLRAREIDADLGAALDDAAGAFDDGSSEPEGLVAAPRPATAPPRLPSAEPTPAPPESFTDEEPSFEAELSGFLGDGDDSLELLDDDDIELLDDDDLELVEDDDAFDLHSAAEFIEEAAEADAAGGFDDDAFPEAPAETPVVMPSSVPPSADAALDELGFDEDGGGFAADDLVLDEAPADDGFAADDLVLDASPAVGVEDDPFGAPQPVPQERPSLGDDPLGAADDGLDQAPAGDDPFAADDLVIGEAPSGDDPFAADDLVIAESPSESDDPFAADDLVIDAVASPADDAFAADDLVIDEAASQEADPFDADDLVLDDVTGDDPFAIAEQGLDDLEAAEALSADAEGEPATAEHWAIDDAAPEAELLPGQDTQTEPTLETPSPASALKRMAQRLATGPKPPAPATFGFFDIAPSASPAPAAGPVDDPEPVDVDPFPELSTAANEPGVEDATMVASLADIMGPAPDLSELDFMLETHLIEDAKELLGELQAEFPDHPEVAARAAKLAEVEAENAREDELIGGLFGDGGGDLGTIQGAQLSELSEDDANTHFDLGLAFKEMGQYRKAVEQLEKAARSMDKRAEALRVLGLCHLEQGQAAEAAERFEDALTTPGVGARARVGLQYDLATAYEAQGRTEDAVEQLKAILETGAGDFLDVKGRLARLGA